MNKKDEKSVLKPQPSTLPAPGPQSSAPHGGFPARASVCIFMNACAGL